MSNFCADCRPGTLQALSKSRSQTSTHMRHSRNSGDRSRTNCEWVDSVNDTDRDSGVHPEDVVRLYLRVVFTCQIGAAAAISLKLHPMACQLLGRSACPMGSPIIIPAFNVQPLSPLLCIHLFHYHQRFSHRRAHRCPTTARELQDNVRGHKNQPGCWRC